VNWLADAAWVAFCLVWIGGAFANKRNVRQMAPGALVVHVAILAVAFSLLMMRQARVGVLGRQVLPDTRVLESAGDVIQIAGLAFCVWARLHIGRNWSGTVTLKEGHSLVTTGPYALVRHPIYSGLMLAFLGRAIEHGQVGGLLAFAIVVVEWKRKSLIEERLMLDQFGAEYAKYQSHVKGLVPYLW
jgi:protein-S-isoprenylcysteine O-methyltransferase Ste14